MIGFWCMATGLAILQSAANPYITILGAKERAAQRITVILRPTDTALFSQLSSMTDLERSGALDELIRRVINPYIGLGFLVYKSPLPDIDTEHESEEIATANAGKT
eukprot:gene4007-5123_t